MCNIFIEGIRRHYSCVVAAVEWKNKEIEYICFIMVGYVDITLFFLNVLLSISLSQIPLLVIYLCSPSRWEYALLYLKLNVEQTQSCDYSRNYQVIGLAKLGFLQDENSQLVFVTIHPHDWNEIYSIYYVSISVIFPCSFSFVFSFLLVDFISQCTQEDLLGVHIMLLLQQYW